MMKTERIKNYWKQATEDWNYIFTKELKTIFRDGGVLIFFFLVPLAYPLLYSFIYTDEVVRDVPIAVVDADGSTTSRLYLRHLDATPDVHIVSYCADMHEAENLVRRRDAYGIVYIPESFTADLTAGRQTHVSAFSDMSGLLYYKSVLLANTNVSLDMNAKIKVERAGSSTDEETKVVEHPIAYEEVNLYNPAAGFASFLIPAVLVLIIQQTLLLGVGMITGTARENNLFRHPVPIDRHYTGLLRIVFGKAMAYLMIYLPISVYVLGVIPRLFRLNQLGAPSTLGMFAIPLLLACIFFAMTIGGLMRRRETCILLIVFTSVPLLFISGISWPGASIPEFWHYVGYLFPSTFGINGFVKINNMGARLVDVRPEWDALWVQAIAYFLTACLVYRNDILGARRRFAARLDALRHKTC